MSVACTTGPSHLRSRVRGSFARTRAAIGLLLIAALAGEAAAQSSRKAYLLRVPVPIAGNVDEQVRRHIRRLLAEPREGDVQPILVLEFWSPPDPQEGTGSEFERSMSLARFLVSPELNAFRTVAYLPRSVLGHAVLPVLACEEIAMQADAEFGAAGAVERNLTPWMRGFYADIADRRRTVPRAVALGMLDPDLKVLQVVTPAGTRYILDEELAELQAETTVQSVDTVVEAGDLARLTGTAMRTTYGFASYLASDRRELATRLEVPVRDLEPDPSLGSEWHPVRIDLVGPISRLAVDPVQRTIEDQVRGGRTNLICLWIDSPGGSPTDSLNLAMTLSQLDTSRVRTVSYIAHQALSDAALIALACDHVVMEKQAILGGPGAYQPSREEVADLRPPVRKLCEDKSRRWSLPVALIDPDLVVYRYRLQGTTVEEYFCEEEMQQLPDPDRWERGEMVTRAERSLQLVGEKAESLGFTRFAVENYEEFKQLYSLEDDPELVEPSWADDLIDYLAQPHVAGTLLFFGGFALMVELSSPGMGAGAFVAAVCFVVFFWSQFLNGTADWLEILLFLTGVAFVALEIFVIPGFGVFGLGGAALVIVSLVLASQTFIIPQNEYQLQQMPRSLITVLGAGAGVTVGLFVLRRFMDRTPVLRRILLKPPEGEQLTDLERREALVDYLHLLGQEGVATTRLVPAGKAMIGDQLVDVVSSGLVVDQGTRLRVEEVHGNRIVVTSLEE